MKREIHWNKSEECILLQWWSSNSGLYCEDRKELIEGVTRILNVRNESFLKVAFLTYFCVRRANL
jgi:hypothetical protein